MRREKEKQQKILQTFQQDPIQQRFFPGLIPRPRQRTAYERECIRINNHFYQHPSLLDPGPSNYHRLPSDSLLHPQRSSSLTSYSSDEELLPSNSMEQIYHSQSITSTPVNSESHLDYAPMQQFPHRDYR